MSKKDSQYLRDTFVEHGLQMERRFGHYITLYNYWFHTRYTENAMAKIKRIKGQRMISRTLP
jgi:hypothetical protein